MSQFVVLAAPKELPEEVSAFGPYRSIEKAQEAIESLQNPFAGGIYFDKEEYDVYWVSLNKLDKSIQGR
jgi:SPX domain protein involved in polyphosphate accumulation